MRFNRDGTKLLTASNDKTAKLWHVGPQPLSQTTGGETALRKENFRVMPGEMLRCFTGSQLQTGHQAVVCCVALSPDELTVATGSHDKTVLIWEATSELVNQERVAKKLASLTGHTDKIWSVCFSPDGTRLATGGSDKTIKVWDTRSYTVRHTLRRTVLAGTFHEIITTVAFSHNGKLVLSSGGCHTQVWDLATSQCTATVGHGKSINALAISQDQRRVMTAAGDGTAKVFEFGSSESGEAQCFDGHATVGAKGLRGCAFSPDGGSCATGGEDGTAVLWQDGALHRRLEGHTKAVKAIAFGPRYWEMAQSLKLARLKGLKGNKLKEAEAEAEAEAAAQTKAQ